MKDYEGTTYFEVIDASDDERYYTLGMFPTLEAALDEIKSCGHEPISGHAEENEIIQVVERKAGWSGHGKTAFEISREKELENPADDDSDWVWPDIAKLVHNAKLKGAPNAN